MSTTEAVIGLVLPDPGTPGVAGSGDPVDGNVLNANWTKVGKYAGAKTSQATVNTLTNNTAETTIFQGLILPNGVIGTAFRATLWGNVDHAAVAATITWRFYFGQGLGNTIAASYPASALTNQQWVIDWDAVCVSTGAAAQWESRLHGNWQVNNTRTPNADITASPSTQNIGLPNNFIKVTAQWSVANAGHILRCRAGVSYWTKAV